MTFFKVALAAGWLAVLAVTARAVGSMGLGAAGDIFMADFAHPWRAQFNSDFLGHILLMAGWIAWRDRVLAKGLALGLLAIMGGGAFSFGYVLVAAIRAKGDMRRLLLGDRAGGDALPG